MSWTRLIGAFALGTLLVGASASASLPREKVQARLEYVDGPLATREEWRAMGAGVDVHLAAIAQDPKLLLILRARAIDALGRLGGAIAQRTLETLLDDPKTPGTLSAASAKAYGRAFRETHPEQVLARLQKLLVHPDWLVRRHAVLMLGAWKTPTALAALRKHSAVESNMEVRAALRRMLEPVAVP